MRDSPASPPASFPYGYFAFVMATGIVSIAAGLVGLGWISAVLLFGNLAAFPLLCGWLAIRLCHHPAAVAADLLDHPAPGLLTIVAATCVLGNQVALASGYQAVVDGFLVAAVVLWIGLIYGVIALTTIRPGKAPFESAIDGSWLLVVVATEALAILATRAGDVAAPPQAALFASLCLFLLGGAFYAALLILIVYRWLFLPFQPDQLTPAYWINMGAAAIATLAGARLLAAMGAAPALLPVRGFVGAATILFWSLATWWIPLLAALTVWRHRQGGVRFCYRLDNWSIVFPLGMYTTATWRFSHELDLRFLEIIPNIFVWVALAAWFLTFLGMTRTALRAMPGRAAGR